MLRTKPDTVAAGPRFLNCSDTAHTPGPWRVDPCWDILGNTDDGNGMVCAVTVNAVPPAEAAANARLIAAAPDMLESLKSTADFLEQLGWKAWVGGSLADIRAAISKAEGRS